jgi:hypothetical protein
VLPVNLNVGDVVLKDGGYIDLWEEIVMSALFASARVAWNNIDCVATATPTRWLRCSPQEMCLSKTQSKDMSMNRALFQKKNVAGGSRRHEQLSQIMSAKSR